MSDDLKFLEHAIQLGRESIKAGFGGPFGALVVRDNKIVAEGWNEVTSQNDPTAHAEIQAIRKACQALSSFQLEGCVLYTSCEPCPMCLGAIYWARPERVVYSCDRTDAAQAGFDDDLIYREITLNPKDRSIPFQKHFLDSGIALFESWIQKSDKKPY